MNWIDDSVLCANLSVVQPLYWLDNPLRTWRTVKDAMHLREPVRVCIGETWERIPRFAGYLFFVAINMQSKNIGALCASLRTRS